MEEERFCGDRGFVVEATDGDFPHVRRQGVRLACCTCTCCCFTLLLGAIGGVAGIVSGAVVAIRRPPAASSPAMAILLGLLWIIGVVLGYGVLGILIGGALGFGIDMLVLR